MEATFFCYAHVAGHFPFWFTERDHCLGVIIRLRRRSGSQDEHSRARSKSAFHVVCKKVGEIRFDVCKFVPSHARGTAQVLRLV